MRLQRKAQSWARGFCEELLISQGECMAKGRFNTKGTKDFLVAAVFCAFLCIWAIRDAWFPTKKVLERHPLAIPISFKVSGVVKDIHGQVGDETDGRTVLMSLHDDPYRAKLAEAEAAFEASKVAKDASIQERSEELLKARDNLSFCSLKSGDFTYKTSHGEDKLQGSIAQILVERASHVDAGMPVMVIKPKDTFYLFNQSLAVIMFIGTGVFLVMHRIASK